MYSFIISSVASKADKINGNDFLKSEYISKLKKGNKNLSPVIPAFAGLAHTEKYVE